MQNACERVFIFAYAIFRVHLLCLMHLRCKPTLLGPIQDWMTGVGELCMHVK